MAKQIQAVVVGAVAPSEYWADVLIPEIRCESKKPVFHESGYASGHANEVLCCPGLADKVKELAGDCLPDSRQGAHTSYRTDGKFEWVYCWAVVRWADKTSRVFLHLCYDGLKDVYTMSN